MGVSFLKNEFYTKLQISPIIAAVNNLGKLDNAIQSPCEIIFLLKGNIINLDKIVQKVKKAEKSVYIHVDLMEGFGRDEYALRYIKEKINPHGIISTKASIIKVAKEMDLFAIQRLFILDNLSLSSGIATAKSIKPDAVEILPGVMNKITEKVRKEINVPVITGGLIADKEDVIGSLKAGAIAISTSKEEIWYM